MFSLVVLLIILGCAAYNYFMGTLVKSFVMIITAICAIAAAFGYFELLGNVLISQNKLVPWAQPISFAVIFIITFAILQLIAAKLTRWPVDFGFLAELIGRVICGIISGLIISGALITILAMAPLSNKIPYKRFDANNPDSEKPGKLLLNADGFSTGWFGMLSRGSFSGQKSFTALHPNFLDQVFLNRHNIAKDVSITTSPEAIQVPKGRAVWPAPAELKGPDGKPISPKSGHKLTFARIGITPEAIESGGKFTLSQLRLVCKPTSDVKNPLSGKGRNVYPIGYLRTANQLQIKKLNDPLEMERSDIRGKARWIDFAFHVPNNYIPVLAEFKQNSIVQTPPPVTVDKAPPAAFFIQPSKCATDFAKLQPVSSAKIYGEELATGFKLLSDLAFNIEDPNHWQNIQTANSIKPAQFEDEIIKYVRAELKIEKIIEDKPKKQRSESESRREPQRRSSSRRRFRRPGATIRETKKEKGIKGMLEPPEGYKLLSLKCNNPSDVSSIKAGELPVLIELSGLVHHPVGLIALGKVGDEYICEFDYCSVAKENDDGCLVISEDSSVAQTFPDSIWLTEKTQEILGFYVLYLVKPGKETIIISVQPGDSQKSGGFKGYEGFLIQ